LTGPDVTFKANRDRGRHGWLRLTPAYSVQLVESLLGDVDPGAWVLDPFCGTGTTALACASRGIACDTVDINPFLNWFAIAKTAGYLQEEIDAAIGMAERLNASAVIRDWVPAIHAIDRWWDAASLDALSGLRAAIASGDVGEASRDLLDVAFCRTMIRRSRASFRHQSMSFQHDISLIDPNSSTAKTGVLGDFRDDVTAVAKSAAQHQPKMPPRIFSGDSRRLEQITGRDGETLGAYDVVLTSPPYPNRMSYVRELRPYMYWLGFLDSAAEAGELDWRAIGGTWGRATSNLAKWRAESELPLPRGPLIDAIDRIETRHLLLGRYVQKYVVDTAEHLRSLRPLLLDGATVTYIVGNSRFFDIMLDTELIYAELFAQIGLRDIVIKPLRRRTSKRELWEYAVSGRV
jgi:DNA modification methylase